MSVARIPACPSLLAIVLAALAGGLCESSSPAAEPLAWRRETVAAPWQPRDSQGEVVFQDRVWIFGGWFDSFQAPPRDVWNSTDGREWKLVTAQAPWKHSDLPMTLTFQDQIWFLGGWYNGRLPGYSASAEVWSSRNGADWQQATPAAGWTPRIAAGAVVFQNKMWILGGTENYYFGDDSSLKNDVWSSSDGKTWECVTPAAGWAPRAYHQAAVLNDRIYVFGGGNYVPGYKAFHDVWSSADGRNWTRETEAAPWSARLWFSTATYRDRIWVLGGWSNNPSKNWGDAWYSADGKTWHQLETTRSWKERHEHSAYVFQDRLWIAGGHATPLSAEVWSIDIPADSLNK